MMYSEILAVGSEISGIGTNALCGQNVEFGMAKLMVRKVTTGF